MGLGPSATHTGSMARLGPTYLRASGAVLCVAIMAGVTPTLQAGALGDWLGTVNAYRAAAGLGPVTENPTLSQGDLSHAQYLVINNASGHAEDPTRPSFTPAGASAGEQSDVLTSTSAGTSDSIAIDQWMAGPFHAVGILDPNLGSVGFGSYRAAGPGVQMAAALNVLGGRSSAVVAGTRLPVLWPGNGATVALRSYDGGESPDPLTACPGYSTPSGLPILLETGSAAAVTAYGLSSGGVALPVCEFDATNYANPDAATQAEGRAILSPRGAVVMVPRAALQAGVSYTATETVNGVAYRWTFGATAAGLPTPATAIQAQQPGGRCSLAQQRGNPCVTFRPRRWLPSLRQARPCRFQQPQQTRGQSSSRPRAAPRTLPRERSSLARLRRRQRSLTARRTSGRPWREG